MEARVNMCHGHHLVFLSVCVIQAQYRHYLPPHPAWVLDFASSSVPDVRALSQKVEDTDLEDLPDSSSEN